MKSTLSPPKISNIPESINKFSVSRLWLAGGAVALIAILAIIALSIMLFAQNKPISQTNHTPVLTVTT